MPLNNRASGRAGRNVNPSLLQASPGIVTVLILCTPKVACTLDFPCATLPPFFPSTGSRSLRISSPTVQLPLLDMSCRLRFQIC